MRMILVRMLRMVVIAKLLKFEEEKGNNTLPMNLIFVKGSLLALN